MVDIKGHEGRYAITKDGRVWSHKKKTNSPKFLKGQETTKGYLKVSLWNNGKYKQRSIHQLVAEAYISNPLNKPQVNHIDGNKQNNCVDNLEWCTPKENTYHAVKTGLIGYRISIDDASEICEAYATGLFTQQEIADCFNVTKQTIFRTLRRR